MKEELKIGGGVQSVWPCEYGFSGYWSLMVPPFKPQDVLILGYGWGTVAALIRKNWGPLVEIIGVDTATDKPKFEPDLMINQDAREYVEQTAGSNDIGQNGVDVVIIDLFNGMKHPDYFKDEDFVKGVRELTKHLLIINSWLNVDEIAKTPWPKYFELNLIKTSGGNNIYFLKPR